MTKDAIDAQDTRVYRGSGTGSPENFQMIPEVKTFSGPGGSADIRDRTTLESTAKEKHIGLPDEGQLTLNLLYVPGDAVHAGLRADRANRTLRNFRIEFNDDDDTKWSFAAYVSGFQVQGGTGADVEATVTLEISGPITEN